MILEPIGHDAPQKAFMLFASLQKGFSCTTRAELLGGSGGAPVLASRAVKRGQMPSTIYPGVVLTST